jgi:hypothetical protein
VFITGLARSGKVVLLRGGARYVSKGNYNAARIAYLARLFADAKFVVPIREPARPRALAGQAALPVHKYLRAAITNWVLSAGRSTCRKPVGARARSLAAGR